MKVYSVYSKEAAARAVGFIETLQHVRGRWAGAPFKLEPWQKRDIIEPLFGTLDEDGNRLYRTAYIELPRKNGKSELAAAVALKLLFADQEMGAEVYGAAIDRDQASIIYRIAAAMVRKNKALAKRAKVIDSTKRIVYPMTDSFYRAIPADAAGSEGFDAHGVVFDEMHVQRTRDLWDVLKTSTGARAQPLMFGITTAGYDRASICWEQHSYARAILDGVIEDPTFFPYIRAAPDDADWTKVGTWRACNPALGSFRSMKQMKAEFREAVNNPAYENTFRNRYLNQWTQQRSRWINLDLWDSNAGIVDEDSLRGRTCYGGLDLGAVDDMTAWELVFPREDDPEELDVVTRIWCPEAKLYDPTNRYRATYQLWARKGVLKTTPGEAIDYAFVKESILRDAEKFHLVDLNVDRLFQAHQLATELQHEGLKVVGMGQGFLSMAAPMQEFYRRLLVRKIHHGGHPVLRWMADNVAVKQDPAGNLKPDKAESQGKIDGIVALVMALDRAMRHEETRSVYEDRGIRSV